jgi:hypothetical protein
MTTARDVTVNVGPQVNAVVTQTAQNNAAMYQGLTDILSQAMSEPGVDGRKQFQQDALFASRVRSTVSKIMVLMNK